nr:VOC family protein [Polymorphobacter sp.]
MAIERIGHINIRTPEFAATMAFFETVFDLVRGPAATMADQTKNAWLHSPDGRPIIHVNAMLPGEVDRPAGVVGRLDHIAFDCSDRPGMAERLDRARVDYDVRETRVPGLVQINLRDPNGIRIELTFGHEAVLRAG